MIDNIKINFYDLQKRIIQIELALNNLEQHGIFKWQWLFCL